MEVLDAIARSVPAEKQKKADEQKESLEIPSFNLGVTPCDQPKMEKTRVDNEVKGKYMVMQEEMENMVVSRPSRFKKLAASIKSPYLQRVKPIKAARINNEESALWEWLFDNTRSLNSRLFPWKNTSCNKENMQTLLPGEWVDGNLGALANGNLTDLDCRVVFNENIDSVIKRILFPIHKNAHHYIISYNIKYPVWEIIDNMACCENNEEGYGSLPYDLHYLFVLWMKANKASKWELLEKLEPAIAKMSWQTNCNSTDCGIFVMRYMESYMAQPWTKWETGLDKESVKQRGQVADLRKMYCNDILGSSLNVNREKVIKKAWDYMEAKQIKGMRKTRVKKK
ncbi:hypothetical protein AgCh_038733 [Apium graveolens]